MITIGQIAKINKLSKYNNYDVLKRKLIEETAELIAALSQVEDEKITYKDVMSECIDVIVVGQQILTMKGYTSDELCNNVGFIHIDNTDKTTALVQKLNNIIKNEFTIHYDILYLCYEVKGTIEYLINKDASLEDFFDEELDFKINRQLKRMSY